MRSSIVTGGLVGIALGAIATFALAHGLFGYADRAEAPASHAGAPTTEIEDVAAPGEIPEAAPYRPLRPGSHRHGPLAQS